MQKSSPMNKLGPIWTGIQFVWSIRRIIAIISMLTALVYLLASETLEQRRTMLASFSASDKVIAELEANLKIQGDAAFSGPSRDGRSITVEQARQLYASVQLLRSELAALSSPTSKIERAVLQYTTALSSLQGALNLFEEGEAGTISVLEALSAIDVPASNYRVAAAKYESSVWRSFWAAF